MTKQEVLEKLTELYDLCHDSSTNSDDGWMAMAGAISVAENVAIKVIDSDRHALSNKLITNALKRGDI